MLNAAQQLLQSWFEEGGARVDYRASHVRGTPRRLHKNIRTVTVDGEEVRLTRGERKRRLRAFVVARIQAELEEAAERLAKLMAA